MVLKVSIDYQKPQPPAVVPELDVGPRSYKRRPSHEHYTVHVDSTRILTVYTHDDLTAGKWFTEVLKLTASNAKPLNPNPCFRPDAIFVGLVADKEDLGYYSRAEQAEQPYEVLNVSVGSHCLMYRLNDPDQTPKLVKAFFDNPRVVVLGKGIADVAKNLKKLHGIEIRTAVDLNELAIRGMKRDDLDLGRYDLDRLAMTVLGKHYDVIRPEEKLYEWWTVDNGPGIYALRLRDEKVMWSTLDAYLALLIGTALVEAIHGARFSKKVKKTARRIQKK